MNLFEVDQPQVIIECAGKKVESEVIMAYKANPNFTEVVKHMDVVSGKGGSCHARVHCGHPAPVHCLSAWGKVAGRELPLTLCCPMAIYGSAADQNLCEIAYQEQSQPLPVTARLWFLGRAARCCRTSLHVVGLPQVSPLLL